MQFFALISCSCSLQDCHLSGTCVLSCATVNLLNNMEKSRQLQRIRSTEKSRGISRQCFDFVRTTGSVVCMTSRAGSARTPPVRRRSTPEVTSSSPTRLPGDACASVTSSARRSAVDICSLPPAVEFAFTSPEAPSNAEALFWYTSKV